MSDFLAVDEVVNELLRTLSASLDVRGLFARISEIARRVVPHELMALGLLESDGRSGRLYALTAPFASAEAAHTEFSDAFLKLLSEEYVVIDRLEPVAGGERLRGFLTTSSDSEPRTIEPDFHANWVRVMSDGGLHALLLAPMRLHGTLVGHLAFLSSQQRPYGLREASSAARISDFVALAVAHERIAEAERQSAVARERAELLEARVERLTLELESRGGSRRPIGASSAWREVLSQAAQVAATDATVLLTGESGTGKEVLARFIHAGSRRAEGPFVALNCAALPEHLLESEIFGHEKGAFTGATSLRIGRIEQANGGTLFLDEVGEMSPAVQAKFLRVLEERELQRLGGAKTIATDVRVLAATNRDLNQAMSDGRFREDLYYRLHIFGIHIPPLRERRDDILPLVEHFLAEIGSGMGRPAAGIAREARAKLLGYDWPGNVRELRNAIERAVILCGGGLVLNDHLPVGRTPPRAAAAPPISARVEPSPPLAAPPVEVPLTLDGVERETIVRALREAGQNKARAARLLGLTRAQLYTRLDKHGLR